MGKVDSVAHITRESIKFASRYFKETTKYIVEVGVGNADNAIDMLDKLNPKEMYLVDPWCPPNDWPDYPHTLHECSVNRKIVEKLFEGVSNVHIIAKESHKAIDDVPNELHLVYIDGIHDEFNVNRDIECWFPKIRTGGIICGHDYYCEGVKRAVLKRFNLDPNQKSKYRANWGAEGNDWWVIKV